VSEREGTAGPTLKTSTPMREKMMVVRMNGNDDGKIVVMMSVGEGGGE